MIGSSLEILVPESIRMHHSSLIAGFVAGSSERRLMASDRTVVEGVRRDGSRFPAAITVGPLDLGTGEKLALATVRDETSLVAVNDQLRAMSAELGVRNSELQEFLLSASHDLREPLRKVRTFAGQLAEALPEDLDEWAQLCLDRTIDAGDRMWVLLDELIGYARLTLTERSEAMCDLGAIVREAVDDLSLRVAETGAEIECDPLPSVVGDRVLLRQLFHNLVANAVKFAREGVTPEIRITGAAVDGGPVIVDVIDNGIGVDPGYEERAFEPFRRVHQGPRIEGSGMGLTICRKVARLHGGDVEILPNPEGPGTTMRVSLARGLG
jgi:two-component system, LuxR family, sensor kinase FixL